MFPLFVSAQYNEPYFGRDKNIHFASSAVLAIWSIEASRAYGFKNPELVGCAASLAVGYGKEFILDKQPSAKDLLANVAGVTVGYFINKGLNKLFTPKKRKIK